MIEGNVGKRFAIENFNKTQDSFEVFPKELFLEVFSLLDFSTLGTACLASKKWNELAKSSMKAVIYKKIAFGSDKWGQYFGKHIVKDEDREKEFSSLPVYEFIKESKKFKKIFPEKNIEDILMLVWINGGVTLRSLGELVKKYFSENPIGYGSVWNPIMDQLGDKLYGKSCWVMMTKYVLPESRNKSYDEQQGIIHDLAQEALIGYEIPGTLEAAICILAYYVDTSIRLFSNNPFTYTICNDEIQGRQTMVGGFGTGLSISGYYGGNFIGAAALKKF